MLRRAAYAVLARSLRRKFRRIVWEGPWNPPPADRPFVLYGNHHAFYDAQILGLLTERMLGRRTVVWMEELDRFPFLAVLGALPFPGDDASRRLRTIRRTARLMRRRPDTALIYFPEAHLHPIEDGVLDFPENRFERLARVLAGAWWWPVVVRVSGWHAATPTATLAGGAPHERPTGRERETLTALSEALAGAAPRERRVLVDGRPGPHERWDMTPLGRWFVR